MFVRKELKLLFHKTVTVSLYEVHFWLFFTARIIVRKNCKLAHDAIN